MTDDYYICEYKNCRNRCSHGYIHHHKSGCLTVPCSGDDDLEEEMVVCTKLTKDEVLRWKIENVSPE